MERFDISIKQGKEELAFEVREYMHHDSEKCKIEVFKDEAMVVSFNPDQHEHLSVCQNPGKLDKQLVHLIADHLEKFV